VAVEIYANGLCACSACAPGDMDAAQVAAAVNDANPTGIDSRWSVSADPFFRTGEPNPCPCNDDAARQHWLLEC